MHQGLEQVRPHAAGQHAHPDPTRQRHRAAQELPRPLLAVLHRLFRHGRHHPGRGTPSPLTDLLHQPTYGGRRLRGR